MQPKVVVAASLHGDEIAPGVLCKLFKQHYNKDLTLNTLDADLRGAAYIVAVARPDGCELDEGAPSSRLCRLAPGFRARQVLAMSLKLPVPPVLPLFETSFFAFWSLNAHPLLHV